MTESNVSRVGVAQVDITPSWEGPISGWGPGFATTKATAPQEALERPQVTAVALSGPNPESGDVVVMATIDIHSGSRPVWEGAAAVAGIKPSQLVLCGSHTHAGPGQPYGNLIFRGGSSSLFGLNRMRRHLVDRVGLAVKQAIANMAPGKVAVVRGDVADVGTNRAVPAWQHYSDDAINQFLTEGPGRSVAHKERLSEQYRDPRLTLLVAQSDDGDQLGVLGWYGIHPNALGPKWPSYSADLYGWARDRVTREFPSAVVGFGGGSAGDMSGLVYDDDGSLAAPYTEALEAQGRDAASDLGERIGDVAVDLVGKADPTTFTAAVEYTNWRPMDTLPSPMYGMNQMAGATDGPAFKWTELEAGVDSERYKSLSHRILPPESGHGPKVLWLFAVTRIPIPLFWLGRLIMSNPLPLQVVRIGDHIFGSVPGEPTTMAGWQIEQDLLAHSNATTASTIGYTGDYCGYWVTPEEHRQQRYEAASTAYGAQAVPELRKQLVDLAEKLSTRSS